MADASVTPVAAAIYLERIADLSGDPAADEALYEELLDEPPVAPDGSIPKDLPSYLPRDTGPTVLANGGDAMIMIRALTSRARGSSPGATLPPRQLDVQRNLAEREVVSPERGPDHLVFDR